MNNLGFIVTLAPGHAWQDPELAAIWVLPYRLCIPSYLCISLIVWNWLGCSNCFRECWVMAKEFYHNLLRVWVVSCMVNLENIITTCKQRLYQGATTVCREDFVKLKHYFPFSFTVKQSKLLEDHSWSHWLGLGEGPYMTVLQQL